MDEGLMYCVVSSMLVQRHAVDWLSDWTRMMAPPGAEGYMGSLRAWVKWVTGRTGITHPAGPSECEGTTTVAYPIGVENASLPTESAKVGLAKVLPSELFAMLSTDLFLEHWASLAKALVSVGLCAPGEDAKSPVWGSQKRHLRTGVFGVEQPDSSMLRLIIDRRRKNATKVGFRQGLVHLRDMGLINEERL
eukprot:6461899-Amphidinium_carterae.1